MWICDCAAHHFQNKTKQNPVLLNRLCETGPRPWLEIVEWLDTCYPKNSLYGDTQVNLILDRPHAKSWLPLASLALSLNSRIDTEAQAYISINPPKLALCIFFFIQKSGSQATPK